MEKQKRYSKTMRFISTSLPRWIEFSKLSHSDKIIALGLGRQVNCTNESWQAIPNDFYDRYGGLSFLLKCNYDSKMLDENLPLYYRKMLDYFKELRAGHPDIYKSEFILWNNKEIAKENKSIFWAHLSEQGICFVHDLLDKNGKFLSLENVQRKYNVHLNVFQYFQLTVAIPSYLKKKAQETAVTNRDKLNERDVFYLSENKALYLTKLRCKDYYNLFQENIFSYFFSELKIHHLSLFITYRALRHC